MARRKRIAKIGREHCAIPDTQVKDGVPTDHLEALGNYIVHKKPEVLIHLGDHWDMPSLARSHHKKGDGYFEGKRYQTDIDSGIEGFGRIEKALQKEKRKGYSPEKHFLLGNHENRVDRAAEDDPVYEGVVSLDEIRDRLEAWGWIVHDFLKPVCIDGVWYAHYFYNNKSGRPYSGAMRTRLKNVGFSFTQGHEQGLQFDRNELTNGHVLQGLVAGSFYEHDEEYRGPQATNEYRGIVYKHEVHDGRYDLMMVSLPYLKREWL